MKIKSGLHAPGRAESIEEVPAPPPRYTLSPRAWETAVRPMYGKRYNDGGVPRGGFGYGGRGHWKNRKRWERTADGIIRAAGLDLNGWGSGLSTGLVDVLEVGCGLGVLTRILRDRGVRAVGIDITDDRTDGGGPDVQGSVLHLPFADDTFGVVIALDVLEHIPWDWQADLYGELRRVLSPGGLLLATVPVLDDEHEEEMVRSARLGLFNHYVELREETWKGMLGLYGFLPALTRPALAKCGEPFNRGRENHPFAFRRT